MGRPLNKIYLGNTVSQGGQITAQAYFPGDIGTCNAYIVNQKGTNTFTMANVAGISSGRVQLTNGGVNLAIGQANITVTPYGAVGSGATASANLGILSATVDVAGTNGASGHYYVPGQLLYPSLPGSSTAAGTYTYRSNLYVDSVTLGSANVITNANGYTVGDTFTWGYAGYTTPAVISVATTVGNGTVGGLTITSAGVVSNTSVTNTTPFSSSVTTNAWATGATFNLGWYVNQLSTVNTGDYSSAPSNVNVALSGSSLGLGATANLSYGVSSVQVTNLGNSYQAATSTFGTVGATAQAFGYAVVNSTTGNVTAVSVTTPGLYTINTAPTVSITTADVVQYAKVIKNPTVETWSGNVYSWVTSEVVPVPGQAQLQTS